MLHPRVWLLACIGWCMIWTLPAQASWEAYQQAGEAAFKRGDYATAQRMFLAAVREARHFGPQDPRLDISLNKLALLRVARGAHSQTDVRTQRVTSRKSHIRQPGLGRRGHQRQPAHRAKRPRATLHRARPARHVAPPVRHGKRREAMRTPRRQRETPRRQRSHTLQRSRTTHHHTGKTTGRRSLTRSRHA
jgi:hypothetical protein